MALLKTSVQRFLAHWPGMAIIALLLTLAAKVVTVIGKQPPDAASWLLVYLTAIYAVLTLCLAVVSARSAQAAERAAQAMEASLVEQRLARWAQFAAYIGFPDGYVYNENADGSASLRLRNLCGQPIMGLSVCLWQAEPTTLGTREIRFGSIRGSLPCDIGSDESLIDVRLLALPFSEADSRVIAEPALKRFLELTNGVSPANTLCAVSFRHLAEMGGTLLVYDLAPMPPPTSLPQVPGDAPNHGSGR